MSPLPPRSLAMTPPSNSARERRRARACAFGTPRQFTAPRVMPRPSATSEGSRSCTNSRSKSSRSRSSIRAYRGVQHRSQRVALLELMKDRVALRPHRRRASADRLVDRSKGCPCAAPRMRAALRRAISRTKLSSARPRAGSSDAARDSHARTARPAPLERDRGPLDEDPSLGSRHTAAAPLQPPAG